MVFAPLPHMVMEMLELSWPKLLLGQKKLDPTAWRFLSDLTSGRIKRPRRRTTDRLEAIVERRFLGVHAPANFMDSAKSIPDGPPWEVTIASLNLGGEWAGNKPFVTLSAEALRLERLADHARHAAAQGDIPAACRHIRQWEMEGVPSQRWALAQMSDKGSLELLQSTASPLIIITGLYLLACFDVDFFDPLVPSQIAPLLPEQRGEKVVRPMTRWLEALGARDDKRSVRELSEYLLSPNVEHEDPESLRSEFKKWWYQGEIPAWSRTPRIVASLIRTHAKEREKEIADKVEVMLGVVRVLDGMLNLSRAIQRSKSPEFDALEPFRDYPLIYRHAQDVRTALLPRSAAEG